MKHEKIGEQLKKECESRGNQTTCTPEKEEQIVKCDRCGEIKKLGRLLKWSDDTAHCKGLCVECSKETYQLSEEKKDWEIEFFERFGANKIWVTPSRDNVETIFEIENFLREKLKEEQEKWRLKNAGLYRQLFGEMNDERTFTAKELWKIFDDYTPLFTEEQKKELREIICKKIV